jgi:hypothetical protein
LGGGDHHRHPALDEISRRLSSQSLAEVFKDELILSNIGGAAAWLIPLLLGCIAAYFLVRKGRTIAGFSAGVVMISASYIFLIRQALHSIDECAQHPSLYCEESVAFSSLVYAIFLGANLAALIGFVVLVNQLRVRRELNAHAEKQP